MQKNRISRGRFRLYMFFFVMAVLHVLILIKSTLDYDLSWVHVFNAVAYVIIARMCWLRRGGM